MRVKPLQIGVAGLGGYAATVGNVLLEEMIQSHPGAVFTAVCDPDFPAHRERIAQLRLKNVRLFSSFEDMLTEKLDAVWLPVPIHLHRPFTEMALQAGVAVMCEKPAAGCVDDVDAMIAARDAAQRPLAIGFHDMADPSTMMLKRALLDGEIGRITSATVHACWPRDQAYFTRNNWAGKFEHEGTWVMDSPANNALSHYIMLAMFLLGRDAMNAANPVKVEAELYRVNPIENYDTISMKLTLDTGATLLVLLTHACEKATDPVVVIRGERGEARRDFQSITLTPTGKPAHTIAQHDHKRRQLLTRFVQFVRGEPNDEMAICTAEMARAHLVAVNGASEAAMIHDVPGEFIDSIGSGANTVRVIRDIEKIFESCVGGDKMLHASGLAPWSREPGRMSLVDYRHFAGPRM